MQLCVTSNPGNLACQDIPSGYVLVCNSVAEGIVAFCIADLQCNTSGNFFKSALSFFDG